MTEQIYTQIVADLMKSRSSEVISNGEPAHAQALFGAFFQYAEKEVLIFCHKLDKRVFDSKSLVEKAKEAIEVRNIEVHVIVQSSQPDDSEFLRLLREKESISSRVSLVYCSKVKQFCDQELNYSVMDERAYRFEENRHDIKAIASMNQTEMAGALTRVFNGTRSLLVT